MNLIKFVKRNFGIVIIFLSLSFFVLCYFYSKNKNLNKKFSFSNIFLNESKRKNYQIQNEKRYLNNITNKNIYSRPMPVDSNNMETQKYKVIKQSNNTLQAVGTYLFGNSQYRGVSELPNYYTDENLTKTICKNDKNCRQATAYASIKNGYINDIKLIDCGKGYTYEPKIVILGGNGSDALCSAILDVDNSDKNKRTSIKKIEIKNSGRNYNSTPQILIEPPKSNHKCEMCSN